MIVSLFAVSRPRRRQRAGSSFPTPQRKTTGRRSHRGRYRRSRDDGKVTPLDVKAGDKILFGKWSGTEVKIDGEDLIIMKESDILGIVG